VSAKHNAAKSHLCAIAAYLKHWEMDVQVLWSGKAYAAVSQYTHLESCLGGLVYEGMTPFPGCDSLADLVSTGILAAYLKPPEGMYFECDASWCIHLQKLD